MRALVIVLVIAFGGCGSDVERRDADAEATPETEVDVGSDSEVIEVADASHETEAETEDTSTETETETEDTSAETEVEDTSAESETEVEDTSAETEVEDTSAETEHEDTSTETEHEDTSTETETEHEDTSTETETEHEDTSAETENEDTSTETEHEDTSPETEHEDASPEAETEDSSIETETEHEDASPEAETEHEDASPEAETEHEDASPEAETEHEDSGVEDAGDEVITSVATCHVAGPEEAARYGDETLAVEVRIVVPGVTDLTTGNDPAEGVAVQLGVGAAGGEVAWGLNAAPIAGWEADGPEDEDAWAGVVPAPDAPGAFVIVARLTTDGGATFVACDGAAALTVVVDPCVAAPCALPQATCDGTERVTFPGPATCTRDAAELGTFTCDAGPAARVDCGDTFRLCEQGACVSRDRWCRLQHPLDAALYPDEAVTTYTRLAIEGDAPSDPTPASLRVELGVAPVTPEPIITWATATPNPGWTGAEPGVREWMAVLEAPDDPGAYRYFHRISIDHGQSWLLCDAAGGPGQDGSEDGFQLERAGRLEVVADPCAGATGPCASPPDTCDGQTLVVHEAPPVCQRPSPPGPTAACDYGAPTRTDCATLEASCDAAALACVELPRAVACHLQWPMTVARYGDEAFDAYVRVAIEDLTSLTSGYDPDPDVRVEARLGDTWQDAAPNLAYVAGDEPDHDEWVVTFAAPDTTGTYDFDFRVSADGGTTWLGCAGAGELVVVADPCAETGVCAAPPDRCEGDLLHLHNEPPTCARPAAGTADPPTCDYGEPTVHACDSDGLVCDPTTLACVHETPACWLQWPPSATLYPTESATAYTRVVLPAVTDATSATDVHPDLEVELGLGPAGSDPATWSTWIAAGANVGWDGALVEPPALDVDEYEAELTGGSAGDLDYRFRVRWLGDGNGAWVACDGVGHLTRLPEPCPEVCADFGASCVGGACVARPAFCRLQWPEVIAAHAGAPTTVYGRYYVAGVSDASPVYDADPYIVGSVGLGAWGSDPASWPADAWRAATPNLAYDGEDFGGLEVGNDELMATLDAPEEGCLVAYAYRVSTDLGRTWTYCDLKVGDGDGSADGYQPERAGRLTVLPGPAVMRVTRVTTADPLVGLYVGVIDAAIQDGSVHALIELRPFADEGRVGSHLGELVDPGCDATSAACDWRVPATGLDPTTCRSTSGFDYVATFGDDTFALEGGGEVGDRVALGSITLWNAELEDVGGALDEDGAIVTAQGTLRGALRQSEVPLPRAPDVDTDGDGTPDACSVVLQLEARGGTIVGIAP